MYPNIQETNVTHLPVLMEHFRSVLKTVLIGFILLKTTLFCQSKINKQWTNTWILYLMPCPLFSRTYIYFLLSWIFTRSFPSACKYAVVSSNLRCKNVLDIWHIPENSSFLWFPSTAKCLKRFVCTHVNSSPSSSCHLLYQTFISIIYGYCEHHLQKPRITVLVFSDLTS